ncbi:MAG: right-handed parallel beta-helix repeat-containing protein [bacterium]|nr:MAG: right-handed parallel beta-helix repeat-containing protein [bacterium]
MKRAGQVNSGQDRVPAGGTGWLWGLLPLLALVSLMPGEAGACTVTNTADAGGGSLRACILFANANPGDTIAFDIPDTDPGYVTSGGDSWWRISPFSPLPVITAPETVLDGLTQTTNRGDTNSRGPEIEINGTGAGITDGVVLTGGNSTIRNLAINRFGDDGIVLSTADGNVVEGCYIGLDPTGTVDLGNVDHGIIVRDGSDNNTIGGPGTGNVISGNGDRGIRLLSTSGNVVQGNLIGTDPSGTADLGNSAWGVHLEGAFGNVIGGQNPGEGNLIAFNTSDGLFVTGLGSNQNLISGNTFFSNEGLGIDLAPDGVGAGPGANNGKTAPVFTGLANSGPDLAVTTIAGPGDVIEFFRVENAVAPAVGEDPTGSGEGYLYLGACVDNGGCSGPHMVSAADGDVSVGTVTATLSGTVLTGSDHLSATATDPSNNTSEFAANNVVVSPCPTVVFTGDLGLGSLRECINYANANPGTTISFDIPDTSPNYVTSGADSWWRISPGSNLPAITAPGTVIDGSTQTANRGNTNSLGPEIEIDGSGAGIGVDGLVIGNPGENSAVRGLAVGNFSRSGISLLVGGNLIAGNYIGLEPDGTTLAGNNTSATALQGGIRIQSAGNTVGGAASSDRNVISGNILAGIVITGGATGNQVIGNYIGLDSGGTLDRGNINDGEGIEIELANGNTIGGTLIGERNVISGNESDGIEIDGADLNVVQGNFIGTDYTGTVLIPNDRDGIDINANGADGATGNTVGGTSAGAGNLIRGNALNGVQLRDELVPGSTTNNSILGNSIYDNGQLGIDLEPDGVAVNDPGDGDTGPNGLQNYPILSSVVTNGVSTTISGTLSSTPNTTFRLEFFASTAPDPLGYGEGQSFLGTAVVTTDGVGEAAFSVNLPTPVAAGAYVSATATDPAGSTSEFASNLMTPLVLVKQAFLASDGSPLSNSSTLPRGSVIRFLIFIDNGGPVRNDVSVQDVLDPAFAYSAGSLRVDNNAPGGASVGDIYASVSAAASLTDTIDADVASITGSTINVGNRFVSNGQLDIAANRVWALLFTVTMR